MLKKIFVYSIFLLFTILYFTLKLKSPVLVEFFFQNQRFEILNKISGSFTNENLAYYLGRSQDIFFGPVTQLISGLLFTWIAYQFFPNAGAKQFGWAVFFYLVVTKWEVLFFPPYGDAIGGPFAEGIWLVRHHFDYLGLLHEPSYAEGGPRVYLFSIYPTYLAFLLKLIPHSISFLVINHLLVFAMAAFVVVLLRQILRKMVSADLALGGALVLLYLPLFQSQTEAINMEMPATLLVLTCAFALIEKRIHLAGVMAILAVLVKGTGVIACSGFLLISFCLFFGLWEEKQWRFNKSILFWSLALLILALGCVALKFITHDQHVSQGMVSWLVGWPSIRQIKITYFFIFSVLAIVLFVILSVVRKGTEDLLPDMYVTRVMLVYGAMWFLLFLNFYAVSPRYRLLVYPFLVFSVLTAFCFWVRIPLLQKGVTFLAIGLALFSSYGYFDGYMSDNDHVQLERSLEYRNDLKLNQLLVKKLEEKYADLRIGAPFVIAQILAIPELGFVKKKLDVMIYGFRCTYGPILEFPGLKNLRMDRTIYVGVKVAQINKDFSYPISPYDKIVEELQVGNKKAWLFIGGSAIDTVFRAVQAKKLQQFLNNP